MSNVEVLQELEKQRTAGLTVADEARADLPTFNCATSSIFQCLTSPRALRKTAQHVSSDDIFLSQPSSRIMLPCR